MRPIWAAAHRRGYRVTCSRTTGSCNHDDTPRYRVLTRAAYCARPWKRIRTLGMVRTPTARWSD